MVTAFSFDHRQLGLLTGVASGEILQFRSITYAKAERLRQAKIQLEVQNKDCTQYGQWCPQSIVGEPPEGGRSKEEIPIYGEDCLNLTITRPKDIPPGVMLPVMLWIHGGALAIGAGGSNPKESGDHLVEYSIKLNKPIIVVSINYRLNMFGFLASSDLVEECIANGEHPCNYGFHDQIIAMQWIQMFLPGFGGDIENITAAGVSAGSTSVASHLVSNPKLNGNRGYYKRAFAMSGVVNTMGPWSLDVQEVRYRHLLKSLGISYESHPKASERLAAIRKTPIEALVKADGSLGKGVVNYSPLDDSIFLQAHFAAPEGQPYFSKSPKDSDMGECPWIKTIILSDTQWEGLITYELLEEEDDPLTVVLSSLRGGVPVEKYHLVDELVDLYKLNEKVDRKELLLRISRLTGDMLFSGGIYSAAQKLRKHDGFDVLYVHFDKKRMTEKPEFLKGVSHHGLDIQYLFMNSIDMANDTANPEAEISFTLKHSELLIHLINGGYGSKDKESPLVYWRSYKDQDKPVLVLGESETEISCKSEEEDDLHRVRCWKILEEFWATKSYWYQHCVPGK